MIARKPTPDITSVLLPLSRSVIHLVGPVGAELARNPADYVGMLWPRASLDAEHRSSRSVAWGVALKRS
jgi:hypothetical protein